jgi:sugar phosphate isomerase/epimerase
MEVFYTCPYWGQEETGASMFLARVVRDGYDGIEINLPERDEFAEEVQAVLDSIRSERSQFFFVAQQVMPSANETVDAYISRMKRRLEHLVTLQPNFINSHTGKDYFSFDDNCRIIEVAENISERSGVPILHETHRGRFTFHASSLLPYLDKFPHLKLTGDFSHWCNVSESLLEDQQNTLAQIIPHIHHIHARVGFEHGPQVNDPFAPEWNHHLTTFMGWWQKILNSACSRGLKNFTITPEFGPHPYMPAQPYTRMPLSDQWTVNRQVKQLLKDKFERQTILWKHAS